jgi:hypothetical protein
MLIASSPQLLMMQVRNTRSPSRMYALCAPPDNARGDVVLQQTS